LHARRRKPKEPLQDLHQDISRLVQLAHPTESGSFLSHVGIRAFTMALDNSDLEFEILKTEPKTLPDAVNEAMRLESLAESVQSRARTAASEDRPRIENARHILAIAGDTEVKDASADLLQRVAQLEQRLKQTGPSGARAASNSSTKPNPRRGRGWRSAGQDTAVLAADAGNKATPETHPCNYCKKLGHWQRDCPVRKNKPKEEVGLGVKPV